MPAAEETSVVGTPPEGSTDLGATSTEGAGAEAASGAAEEPELYTVKVGGKEEKVTLQEALNGYQRNQDYTRKTQEVAAREQQLQQYVALATALENNPAETLQSLARALNVDLTPAQARRIEAAAGDEDDPMIRMERQVTALSQQLTSQQEAQRQAASEEAKKAEALTRIQNETADLHARYGDFVEVELYQYAARHQSPNLELAFKAWQHEIAEDRRLAELNAATEAKRRSQVVAGGTNPAGVVSGSGKPSSVREAWAAAIAQHS